MSQHRSITISFQFNINDVKSIRRVVWTKRIIFEALSQEFAFLYKLPQKMSKIRHAALHSLKPIAVKNSLHRVIIDPMFIKFHLHDWGENSGISPS